MLEQELDFYKEEMARVEEIIKCQDSFHAFVKAAWHIVEGAKPFIDNWSIGAICEHLEAVHRLEIKKLKIQVPPRNSKSTITTIMWPVCGVAPAKQDT